MKLKSSLVGVALLLCGIATLPAATLNFSMAYYAGVPAKFEDSNGTWWNTPLPWSLGKVNNAVDEFNQATSIGFSIDARFSSYFATGPTSSTLGYASQISRYGLYVASDYPKAAISFSGLDVNLTYDLTFYASVGANGNASQDRQMLIDILGESVISQTSLNVHSTATIADEAMITVYGVRPDSQGKIGITFSYPSTLTTRGHINAISITPIPEPGTLAFLSMGIFAIATRQFRRKR